jgi:hypothetical protein
MALTEKELEEAKKLAAGVNITPNSLASQIPVENLEPSPRISSPSFTDYAVQSLPEMGAMAGSVIGQRFLGPARGAMTLGRTMGASAFGAGGGAGIGTAAEQTIRDIRGQARPENISGTMADQLGSRASEILANAAENAALDAAGNLVFSLGGKAYRVSKEYLQSRNMFSSAGQTALDLKQQIQQLLQEEGATLTRFQAEPSAIRKTAESVARSGISGQNIFNKQQELVNTALTSTRDKILGSLTQTPREAIATGKEYLQILEDADKALSDAVAPFYKNLADRSKNILVNFNPIKNKAFTTLEETKKLTETNNAATILGDDVAKELTNISNVVSDLTFDQAHQYRSILNKRLRSLRNEVGPDSPVIAKLSEAVKMLDTQMDEAAKKLDPTLLQEYRATSQLYKDSITELYPDLLQSIIQKAPERIGEAIFKSGNVSQIQDAYKALARAKKLDPNINVAQVKADLQRGYLESFFGQEGTEITAESLANLSKKLTDTKFKRTFEATLDKPTQDRIKLLASAGKAASEKPGAALSLLVAGKQADGVALLAAAAAGGGLASGADPLVSAMVGAGLLFTPKVLAKMSTNPKAVNQILKLDAEQKKTGFTGGNVAQVVEILRQAGVTADDYQQQVAQQAQQQETQGLSEEEFNQLREAFQ